MQTKFYKIINEHRIERLTVPYVRIEGHTYTWSPASEPDPAILRSAGYYPRAPFSVTESDGICRYRLEDDVIVTEVIPC